jgi:NAD+ diphosphatase
MGKERMKFGVTSMNSTDNYEGIFAPAFGAATTGGAAITLPFCGDALLVTPDDMIPDPIALKSLSEPLHSLKIGSIGAADCEMRIWSAQQELSADLVKADLRRLMCLWPQALAEAVNRGRQLAVWIHENRFCGVCGGKMETSTLIPSRKCAACGFAAFPRISPVCIVLVARRNEVLLARSPHFTPGIYSVLAGFVEAGESVEACVRREVKEEVGIEVGNLRWFGSQSWPFPHSLMLGFMADYAGGELVPQEEEIEDVQWFRRDNLPALPAPWTIARLLIQSWIDQESLQPAMTKPGPT